MVKANTSRGKNPHKTTKLKVALAEFREHLRRFAHFSGIKRRQHELHGLTLRRLILLACSLSLVMVLFSSWMFYSDSRSKYDLVRPGRRVLPKEFRVQGESTTQDETAADVKLKLQNLQSELEGLKLYGDFKNDGLSDSKVLQNYLDEPVVAQ